MILYGIKNCDSVKKARRFLEQHQLDYQFFDLKTQAVTAAILKHWFTQVTWKDVFNQRSKTFRELPGDQKQDLNETKAMALIIARPTLIKRPVLDHEGAFLIGFKENEWQKFFHE
jgi:arsenate reductase